MSVLMSYYKFIVKSRVMSVNHLESITAKDGVIYAINELQKEIKSYKEKEKDILAEIVKIITKDDKLKQGFENIKSIIGIGEKSAIILLTLNFHDTSGEIIKGALGNAPYKRKISRDPAGQKSKYQITLLLLHT